MKRIFIECSACHYIFSPKDVLKLGEVMANDKLYKCIDCGETLYFYVVYVCSRKLTKKCDDCRFRFLCYTDATQKA